MLKKQHDETHSKRSIHEYIFFGFLTIFCGSFLLVGLFVASLFFLTDEGQWQVFDWLLFCTGIVIGIIGLGGLIYITVCWRRLGHTRAEDEQLRLSQIESFLDNAPPRQHVPRKFYQANALTISDSIGALLAASMCPGALIFMILTWPWPRIIALQFLLFCIPGTVLWGAWSWLRITERIERRRLLRDGIAVEGTLSALEKTSIWTQILFPPQNSTQYRATYRFSWLGEQQEASQLLHAPDHHYADNRWIPETTKVRLLVLPHDPLSVLWAKATLDSPPLYPPQGD